MDPHCKEPMNQLQKTIINLLVREAAALSSDAAPEKPQRPKQKREKLQSSRQE
jgi:hypothetical protein